MLTLVMLVNYADRQLVSILVQPIKQDLGITDAQVGLLAGFAFSAMYAIAALPLAALSDRGNRRNIVVVCLMAWSAMTALCGLSSNFIQLFLARVGVGIGEAGGIPASHSMIADLVPPRKRSFAFAFYSAGASIGIGIALAAGGVLEGHIGWRNTFLLLGLPGLLLSLAVWMTVDEPKRGLYAHLETLAPATKPTRGAIRTLLADRVFLYLLIANWLAVLTVFGASQWTPAFIERSFGSSRSEIGAMLGATQSVSMLAGMILGGLLTDRLARNDAVAPYRITIWTGIVTLPMQIGGYLAPTPEIYYIASFAASFISALATGAGITAYQSIVPTTMRASATALTAFGAAFIGFGMGPLLIGLASDALSGFGAESLRWALVVVVTPALILSIACYWTAFRRVSARHRHAASRS
jgi:predicted MFS family arabinose efflux permease